MLMKTRNRLLLDRFGGQGKKFFVKVCQIFSFSQPVKTLLAFVIVSYVIIDVAFAQYYYYQNYVFPRYADVQQLAPAMKWLNAHVEKESVIVGSFDIASTAVITIYTNHNVYVSPHAQFYPVPARHEIRDRVYNLMSLMGIRTFHDFNQIVYNYQGWYVFLDNIGLSYEEYQDKLTEDLYSELKKYQADYLIYGPSTAFRK